MRITLHQNQVKELEQALRVSIRIFEPSSKEKRKYHNKNNWHKKIVNNGLFITAWKDEKMVGFSICYPKKNSLHIWNVGVLKEHRKLGVWKAMYGEIMKYALENRFNNITLNTYKNKFPGMYAFCLKNGFKEYKTEKGKSFFIKPTQKNKKQ